jgi:hypothetical protein
VAHRVERESALQTGFEPSKQGERKTAKVLYKEQTIKEFHYVYSNCN